MNMDTESIWLSSILHMQLMEPFLLTTKRNTDQTTDSH